MALPSPRTFTQSTPRFLLHPPVCQLQNYWWLEACLPPPQLPPPHGCGDPQSPQGLCPVVSGRNLGELYSLSSLGLGSWAGAPDGGKITCSFPVVRNQANCPASQAHSNTLWQNPGPWLCTHLLVGSKSQTADKGLLLAPPLWREGQRNSIGLCPSPVVPGGRPRTPRDWEGLGPDPEACHPEPRVLGPPVRPPPAALLTSRAIEEGTSEAILQHSAISVLGLPSHLAWPPVTELLPQWPRVASTFSSGPPRPCHSQWSCPCILWLPQLELEHTSPIGC